MMRRRFMSASGIPDNQIWYTTNDGNIIEPVLKPSQGAITADYGFGSMLVSNQYYDKGIIKTYGVITQIGRRAFTGASSLISITWPRQVVTIGVGAFDECTSLSQIDLSNVATIGVGAFNECTSLRSIKLSKALEHIPFSCFANCMSLEEVTIGENVKEIDGWAFYKCKSLKKVYIKATTPPIILRYNQPPFDGAPISKVFVPSDSVTAYKNASYWQSFTIEGYNFD